MWFPFIKATRVSQPRVSLFPPVQGAVLDGDRAASDGQWGHSVEARATRGEDQLCGPNTGNWQPLLASLKRKGKRKPPDLP